MHTTELSDRLAQLNAQLAEARTHREYYDRVATEARDQADEQDRPQARDAYMAHSMRLRGQAVGWANRVHELVKEISALEASSVQAAPVVLSRDQLAAVDDTAGIAA